MPRKMTRDYAQSDIETLMRRGEWRNYREMIDWLEAPEKMK